MASSTGSRKKKAVKRRTVKKQAKKRAVAKKTVRRAKKKVAKKKVAKKKATKKKVAKKKATKKKAAKKKATKKKATKKKVAKKKATKRRATKKKATKKKATKKKVAKKKATKRRATKKKATKRRASARAPAVEREPEIVNLEKIRAWSRRISTVLPPTRPLLSGPLVLATCTDKVVALDAAKGTYEWKVLLGDCAYHTPVARDELVYVADFSGQLWAIETSSGDLVWKTRVSTAKYPGLWTPTLTDDEHGAVASCDGHIYGFELETGAAAWEYESDEAAVEEEFADTLIRAGERFVGVTCSVGVIAWEAEDGAIAWRRSLKQDAAVVIGVFDVGGGELVALGSSGRHHARVELLTLRAGKPRWGVNVPDTGMPQSVHTIDDDVLVVGVNAIVRVSLDDGEERWRYVGESADVCVTPEGRVLVLSTHSLHELHPATGAVIRRSKPQTKRYFSKLAWAGGDLLISTYTGVMRLRWPVDP